MDKLEMKSKNLVDENIEFIASKFPNCVTEAKDDDGKIVRRIDFDLLKQELSNVVVDGDKERYVMTWPDKKQAILTANAPISKTLRPCKEESVGKDGTNGVFDSENLYIEGDNLDVLKLLRETYLNKIKMIYIDPPYNTGNDFVYNDDFATDTEDYLQRSNQVDDQGNRMTVNNESNGRFHTDWLNMIYPRLKLAKDLLSDDGGIFISIDHNEVENLKKICNEIFGESNCLGLISVINNLKGRSDDKYFATCNEFLLSYAKNNNYYKTNGFELSDEEYENDYDKQDEIGFYKTIGFRKTGNAWDRINRPLMYYPVLYKDGKFDTISKDEYENIYNQKKLEFNDTFVEKLKTKYTDQGWEFILPKNENGEYGRWRWGRDTFLAEKDYNLDFNNSGTLCTKMRATLEDGSIRVKTAKTCWYKPEYDTGSGAKFLQTLFKNSSTLFDNPKSIIYIKDLIKIATKNNNDLVLDFFSGSATTAHAVMQLNSEDGGNRKFIMVQLPEVCDEKSEAYKAGYKNICEIGKERIRRAGKKIYKEVKNENMKKSSEELMQLALQTKSDKELKELQQNYLKKYPDIGFRDLKLDSSCMKDVYYNPSQFNQDLLERLEDNIKEDRNPEDLLFQVMLDMGVILSSEIKAIEIKGKKVFNVNDGNLVCCFDKDLTDEVVTEIAKMKPLYAVFRDSSFPSDSVAVNFDQIFATYSPTTTRKVL